MNVLKFFEQVTIVKGKRLSKVTGKFLDGTYVFSDISSSGFYIYENGLLHNLIGPAYLSGDYHDWHINGYEIDNEIINAWLKENDVPLDWNIWTDSDKMLFSLHWSDYTE